MTKFTRFASALCFSFTAVFAQACTTDMDNGFVEYGAVGDPDAQVDVDEQDNSLSCGDGVVSEAEECDDGDLNADNGACTSTCKINVCGDGFVYEGAEECDMGQLNGENSSCSMECELS